MLQRFNQRGNDLEKKKSDMRTFRRPNRAIIETPRKRENFWDAADLMLPQRNHVPTRAKGKRHVA